MMTFSMAEFRSTGETFGPKVEGFDDRIVEIIGKLVKGRPVIVFRVDVSSFNLTRGPEQCPDMQAATQDSTGTSLGSSLISLLIITGLI